MSLLGRGAGDAVSAASAVAWIGPEASECVPHLIQACDNKEAEGYTFVALGQVGPSAAAATQRLLRYLTPPSTRQAPPAGWPATRLATTPTARCVS